MSECVAMGRRQHPAIVEDHGFRFRPALGNDQAGIRVPLKMRFIDVRAARFSLNGLPGSSHHKEQDERPDCAGLRRYGPRPAVLFGCGCAVDGPQTSPRLNVSI